MALPHLQIGDELLGDGLLDSVEVTQRLNAHSWCTIVCRNTEDRRIDVESLIGQPVEITTTDDGGVPRQHFAGTLHDVSLTYGTAGNYSATLLAVSESYALDVSTRKQYFPESTLTNLAGSLAGDSGLSIAVHAPSGKPLNYVQYGETDFAFLHRVADDHGAWLRPVPGGLEILSDFQTGTTLSWREEGTLLRFAVSLTRVPGTVSGSHYDHHAMQSETFQELSRSPQLFSGAASFTAAAQPLSLEMPSAFEPQRARAMTLADYREQLQSESERALGSAVLARGTSREQALRAGNTVAVEGPLDAAGTYGLVSVVHRWTPGGYENHFTGTPWKHYREPAPPPQREWSGAVPARVVDHHDPKKMGRLRIQFFWQADNVAHWARALSPHAGPGRGMMFLPEVGDEVAVMFEDGDPERPVIVGSLWNGVQQAPRTGFFSLEADIPENLVKRIYTKSGNRLQMVDTPAKPTVMLATPSNTHVQLSEKHDSTGRPLTHIHSTGDILLTAPNGRVHIQGNIFTLEVGNPAIGTAGTVEPLLLVDKISGAGSGAKQALLPCSKLGMDSDKQRKLFLKKIKQIQRTWSHLDEDQRLIQLGEVVNEQTDSPSLDVVASDIAPASGIFRPKPEGWQMAISPAILSSPKLSDADAATIANTLYHETRHSEQAFWAVRNLAGFDEGQEKLKSGFPSTVVDGARANPIKAGDKEYVCSEVMRASFFGDGRAKMAQVERDALKNRSEYETAKADKSRVDANSKSTPKQKHDADTRFEQAKANDAKSYADYRALAPEADAFATADEIK